MKKFGFVLLSLLCLQACYKSVSKLEAEKISVEAVCPYFEKFEKDCEDIVPDEYQEEHLGIRMFTFFVQKDPEYTVVILVKKNGSYEISKWDDR